MDDPLEEAKEVLNDLEGDLKRKKKIWDELRGPNPDWEEVSEENWVEKQARCWLHGATDIVEANELEHWLLVEPSLSITAQNTAHDHYFEWSEYIRDNGVYLDFSKDDLPEPLQKESLIEFIIRLSLIIEKEGWGPKKRKRALKGFLHFLRSNNEPEEVAFIEHIFPKIMDLFHGSIIRIIPPEKYPICRSKVVMSFSGKVKMSSSNERLGHGDGAEDDNKRGGSLLGDEADRVSKNKYNGGLINDGDIL